MASDTVVQADDLRIPDDTARLILERAIQLDAQRPGDTTLGELQRIAKELNVSPSALMEAIRELQAKAVAAPAPAKPAQEPPSPAVSHAGGWWRSAAIGVGGFLFAAVNVSDSYRNPEISLFLLFFGSIALVLMHRRNRTPGAYQRDLLALFGGVTAGWILAGGRHGEEMVYVSTFSWLLATTVGGWLTRFRFGRKSAERPVEP